MMNKYRMRIGDLSNVVFFVAIVIAIAAMLGPMAMDTLNERHQEIPPITRVENGGVLDLDTLPENLKLPNGVVLMDVSIGVAEAHFVVRKVPMYRDGVTSHRLLLVETFLGDPNADVINYGNQEMISGLVVSEDQSQDLKVTWLDGQQQKVGHTYARIGAASETNKVVFWALPGSENMRIELA